MIGSNSFKVKQLVGGTWKKGKPVTLMFEQKNTLLPICIRRCDGSFFKLY